MKKISLAVLPLLLLLPVAAMAGDMISINFDYDTDGNAINAPGAFVGAVALTDLYAAWGVNFAGPAPGNGGAILDQDGGFGVNARSGSNFLAFNREADLDDGGWPGDPECITFDKLWCSVSIWGALGNDYMTQDSLFMDAYDAADGLLGTVSISSESWAELSFSDPNGIKKIKLYGSQDNAFVFDDLSGEVCDCPPPPTPELSTWALLACSGLVGVALRRRRKS